MNYQKTKKNKMPPQEYRSKLFDAMFQRYVKLHGIEDVRLSVVEVNGINEIYYFHVIYRETHSVLAALIVRNGGTGTCFTNNRSQQ